MKNLVIICQAPADVQYAIDIYKKNIARGATIIVINVLNVFLFFNSLNLENTKIYFIPYKLLTYKNVISLIKERRRLRKLWNEYRTFFVNSDVYFFSVFEDWITAYLLDKAGENSNNSIYYCNHYDNSSIYIRKKVSLGNWVRLTFLKYLTGVSFRGNISEKFPEYCVPENCESIIPHHDHNKEFCYKVKEGKNCILFLSAPDGQLYTNDSYINTVLMVLDELRSASYIIYIKAHPRVGIQNELTEIDANIIPEYIPSEFIDATSFTLCLGFESTSLASFAYDGVKTYSLLPLLQIMHKEQFNVIKEYLHKMSKCKIAFVSDLNFIRKIKS